MVGCVTRGEEWESDGGTLVVEVQDGVGVTFRQHRLEMGAKWAQRVGKNW